MVKKHDDQMYLFAVAMRGEKTTATFSLKHPRDMKSVEVIGENRTIDTKNSVFTDDFEAWDVHIYRIR
jgi:hypothetical protein